MRSFPALCLALAATQLFAAAQDSEPKVLEPKEQVFLVGSINGEKHLHNAAPITVDPFPLHPPEPPRTVTILFQPDPEHATKELEDIQSVQFTVRNEKGRAVYNRTTSSPPFSLFAHEKGTFQGASLGTKTPSTQLRRSLQKDGNHHSFLLQGRHTLEAAVLRKGDKDPKVFTVDLKTTNHSSSLLTHPGISGIELEKETSDEWFGSLKEAATKAGIAFGSAICQTPFDLQGTPRCRYGGEGAYQAIVREELAVISPERECKWWFTRTSADLDEIDFTGCDDIFDLAIANKQQARFHTLLWHSDAFYGNIEEWLHAMKAVDKRAQLIGHIEKMVERYRTPKYSNIIAWDVVNEAIDDAQDEAEVRSGGYKLRDSMWHPDLPEYIDLAFVYAHKAGQAADAKHNSTTMPPMKLFYNDYSCESTEGYSGTKSDAVYNLLAGMKRRGVPVAGVGFQSHVNGEYSYYEGVRKNMRRLGELGLEVQFTELDVACGKWGVGAGDDPGYTPCKQSEWTPERELQQAEIYRQFMRVCLEEPNCTGFITWGFVDKSSWLNRGMYSPDWPLLFDSSYKPKQSYLALREELRNHTIAAEKMGRRQ
ncbi:unnamed protein product [Vitrella brassicaformis CCMP3155]|uniref:endo-1,4-beta-xylanase n=1 Tax=Vitrella brassicaformis (strain CCMP3155) TaxID=1169540 RepID=A0A0G4EI71_VITBC|nr:unnamed protein product [Vitrella brassicaformis CCMP3155]|eukprot:CEL95576.1 unnamed protein product [Vitrella brassicaformis CCMP3155]